MNKIEMVKSASGLAVTMGVTKIVGNIVIATMPAGTGALAKGLVYVGGLVLTSMATEAAVDHVEKKFNGLITEVKEVMAKKLEAEKSNL